MKILILSRKRSLYTTHRLRKEIQRLGHDAVILDPLKLVLHLSAGGPRVSLGWREVTGVDAIIPRVGTFGTWYSITVVRHFALMGVPSVNDADAITHSRDKFGCLQILSRRGIRVPDTVMSRYPKHLDRLLPQVGGTPVIMKLLRGTQGTGVIFAESATSVESMLETIWSLGEDIMLQRYVRESRNRDIRVLVIDGKVRCAMRRVGREGEFRSNIHRGGRGEAVKLPAAYERTAVRAAQAVGLRLAGVDLLESDDGPMVIEVNSSPGFQGLEAATGENVASMIARYAVKLARGRS